MKVAISACLLGSPVRYDGKSKPNKEVLEFAKNHEVVAICPEVFGGLTIPHPPSEIQTEKSELIVKDIEGNVTTSFFLRGAYKTLESIQKEGVTHVILKAKSPSCGVGSIYDGTFSGSLVEGDGVTTRLLRQAGICVATEYTFKEVFKINE